MFVNAALRELDLRIAIIGPPKSGKKTVMRVFEPNFEVRGKVNWTDAAYERIKRGFYWRDFLPPKPVLIEGNQLRVHLITGPEDGIAELLAENDAFAFIADSQRDRQQETRDLMRRHAEAMKRIPGVLLCNKSDLPNVVPAEEMNVTVNPHGLAYNDTVATTGTRVIATFGELLKQTVTRYRARPR